MLLHLPVVLSCRHSSCVVTPTRRVSGGRGKGGNCPLCVVSGGGVASLQTEGDGAQHDLRGHLQVKGWARRVHAQLKQEVAGVGGGGGGGGGGGRRRRRRNRVVAFPS